MSDMSQSGGREAPPAFLSGPPLASIGPLPPDLHRAFNAAIYLAGSARSMRTLLSMGPPVSPAMVDGIIRVVDTVRSVRNACNAAIKAVTNDLAATRNGPARFGEIIEPNAHEAAITLSREVLRNIWNAADALAYSNCFLDPSARMDSSLIRERFDAICEHFQTCALPDSAEMIAEIQIEAAKAAQAHRGAQYDDRRRDGAVPPDKFRWEDVEAEDLSSPQWKLLDALCENGLLRDAVPIPDLLKRVYGSTGKMPGDPRRAIEQLRRRTQEILDGANIRLIIDVKNQSYRLIPIKHNA